MYISGPRAYPSCYWPRLSHCNCVRWRSTWSTKTHRITASGWGWIKMKEPLGHIGTTVFDHGWSYYRTMWGVPEMGVPPVIILILVGFSLVHNPAKKGYPLFQDPPSHVSFPSQEIHGPWGISCCPKPIRWTWKKNAAQISHMLMLQKS